MLNFLKKHNKTPELTNAAKAKVGDLQHKSIKHVHRYITKRAGRVLDVKRFVISWLLLVGVLCITTFGTFLKIRSAAVTTTPAPGGTYTEGMVGEINNINPLFSSGAIDDSVSRLVFNGLVRHDDEGQLVGDLAKSWSIDESKKIYTVELRDDVKWHDGRSFTSKDVVATIDLIQNTSTRSTLFASWQGIKVSAVDKYSVKFELPAPFAPFINALNVPILPSHLVKDISPEKLRTDSFSVNPVGTGPFIFKALRTNANQDQQVEFSKNVAYYRGEPKLDRFIMHLFKDDEILATALKNREITAAVDLKPESIKEFNKDRSIRSTGIPLNSGVFAFFKTSDPKLEDIKLRNALAMAIDRGAILDLFDTQYSPLKTPILSTQLGYDAKYNQITNLAQSEKDLESLGWIKQSDGSRKKDGVKLEFNLLTANSAQYSSVAGLLQEQWSKVGVSVKTQLLTLEQLQQNGLTAHAYDILLYGISIGYDPDVYAYWHSSQARSGGLNFSEWRSSRADTSLDVARTRTETVLRDARYKTFLDEWQKSAPAVALYQPMVNYSYHQNASGFKFNISTNASERLTSVENWTVNTKDVKRTP